MPDDSLDLSRRKALAALGTIGAASAGAGLGTSAYFSDQETFDNNQLVAGELDLKVSWEEHYSDWLGDEQDIEGVRMVESTADLQTNEVGIPAYDDPMLAVRSDDTDGDGTPQIEEFMDATLQEQVPDEETREQLAELPPGVDPCEALADVPDDLEQPVIDLKDIKPGDFGEVTFDFTICDNPGQIWLTGDRLEASEGGTTEPEADDPDEGDGVELLDELRVIIWYDNGDNILDQTETYVTQRTVDEQGNPASSAVALTGNRRIITQGTLRDVLADLTTGVGVPLDGIPNTNRRDCFAPTPTIHNVGVSWALPVDHANEIQSDAVTFDLGFYTEQCRHNDSGTTTALVEGSPSENDIGERLQRLDLRFTEEIDVGALDIAEFVLDGVPLEVDEIEESEEGRLQLLFFSDKEQFANEEDPYVLDPDFVIRILLKKFAVEFLGTPVGFYFNPGEEDDQDDENNITEPEADDPDDESD